MAVYEASVEHAFSARHALPLPNGSREASHSHLWQIKATFRSDRLDETMGVVVDFLDIQQALREIADKLQGADLNKLPEFSDGRPSAERVAQYIAEMLIGRLCGAAGLHRVEVTEAPGCSAAYYPDAGGRD